MTTIDPAAFVRIYFNDALNFNKDSFAVLVFGVEQQQFHAIDCLSVGCALEHGNKLSLPLVQIFKRFLDSITCTPDCLAI